ncbi:MAG: sulfotransferase [Pseudomonadota bacterium]
MSAAPIPLLFVFGALRSGTTLLRLMLRHHAGIQSPGEADFLFDHVTRTSAGWDYDIEALKRDRIFWAKDVALRPGTQGKALADGLVADYAALEQGMLSLNIHRNAPKMVDLFPEAKIIHLLRDPRDVARSSIRMGWAGNSYFGVDHWIDTEAGWDKAEVNPDNVLTVRFEELIADLEPQLTRICQFLGLEFDPAMLKYYENTTYGPPDPKIAQKWRHKASPREIALIEGRCGPLLTARGYESVGEPAMPTATESLQLSAQNRLIRWQHNIKRYGLPLFAGHHAARALGLRGTAQKLADRQEAIRIANLK